MKIHFFQFNPLQENTYIIWDPESLECAIVDAGCYDTAENNELKKFISSHGLIPKYLLGTHAHIDHIFGNWYVKQLWNIPYYLHKEDVPMLDRSVTMAAVWNLQFTPSDEPDFFLEAGQIIKLGNGELEVRFVPGHSPGHVVFINHANHWVIAGDTLFQGSIGRTDLPGGNHDVLLSSIREQLFTLPEDYLVYPGHGPKTNIGFEKKNNPFFISTHWQ